jgi:hypothetical protein
MDFRWIRPNLLPADVVDFTGRKAELAELDAGLLAVHPTGATFGPDPYDDEARRASLNQTTVPVSLVCGPAGVGKSALAVHWANRVRDRFPDGQLYADLREAPERQGMARRVLHCFLTALGVPAAELPLYRERQTMPPETWDDLRHRYEMEVGDQRLLIVLDNADSQVGVRLLLPPPGSSAVLVTSRDPLAGLFARRLSLDQAGPSAREK